MTAYVFLGPSLPASEVPAVPGITVLPPIGAYDLLRLPLMAGDIVAIVDGYFHRPAVRHQEILDAIGKGIRVWGAASMGALRAAELDRYGMAGHGVIYRAFRDGLLVDDDEVALLHAECEAGYQAMSRPLVTLRATLASAAGLGLIGEGVHHAVLAALAALPYRDRTERHIAALARSAGMAGQAADELQRYCEAHLIDPKASDARLLLRRLAREQSLALRAPRQPPAPRDPSAASAGERTVYFRQWQVASRSTVDEADEGEHRKVADEMILRALQLRAADMCDTYRAVVLRQVASDCRRDCPTPDSQTGIMSEPENHDLVELLLEHGQHLGLYRDWRDPDAAQPFVGWLTADERGSLSHREEIAAALVRALRSANAATALLDAAYGCSGWTAARRAVVAAAMLSVRVSERHPHFDPDSLSADRIKQWWARRWNASVDEFELAAADRGLTVREVLAVSREGGLYLLDRYNPEFLDGLRVSAGQAAPASGGSSPSDTA